MPNMLTRGFLFLQKTQVEAVHKSRLALSIAARAASTTLSLRRAPLRLEPPEWYSFLVVFFGTSVFQEVVSKARFEDQEVSCEVPSEAKLLSNEVEE